jgi:hypothetical protein
MTPCNLVKFVVKKRPEYLSSVTSSSYTWRVWGRGEVCTGFWWGSLREGDHWGDTDVGGRIILRGIFRN